VSFPSILFLRFLLSPLFDPLILPWLEEKHTYMNKDGTISVRDGLVFFSLTDDRPCSASARSAGYAASYVCDENMEDSSPYIHSAQDTIATLDFGHILEHVKVSESPSSLRLTPTPYLPIPTSGGLYGPRPTVEETSFKPLAPGSRIVPLLIRYDSLRLVSSSRPRTSKQLHWYILRD
jgi:hypothetical protein